MGDWPNITAWLTGCLASKSWAEWSITFHLIQSLPFFCFLHKNGGKNPYRIHLNSACVPPSHLRRDDSTHTITANSSTTTFSFMLCRADLYWLRMEMEVSQRMFAGSEQTSVNRTQI